MSAPDKYSRGVYGVCATCRSRPCQCNEQPIAVGQAAAPSAKQMACATEPICLTCNVRGCSPSCAKWVPKPQKAPVGIRQPGGRKGVPFTIWLNNKFGRPSIVAVYRLTASQQLTLTMICLETFCKELPDGNAVSINRIATLANLNRRTVSRACHALEAHGLLKRDGDVEGGEPLYFTPILPGYWPVADE